jgi:hypothetical protein
MEKLVKLLQQLKVYENKWAAYSLGKVLEILIEQGENRYFME